MLNVTRMKQDTESPNKFLVREKSVKVKIKQITFDSCKIIKSKIYSIGTHYNFALEIIKSLTKNMSNLFGANLSLLSPPKTLSFFYIIDKCCNNTLPGCENYMFIFTSKIKSKLLLQQIFPNNTSNSSLQTFILNISYKFWYHYSVKTYISNDKIFIYKNIHFSFLYTLSLFFVVQCIIKVFL